MAVEEKHTAGQGAGQFAPNNGKPSESDGEEFGEDDDILEETVLTEGDRLVHWWCRKQVSRCLKKLKDLPSAAPFLKPLPWQELGLDDYLEVVEEPVDLRTIEFRFEKGEYDDEDGLCDPDHFWEDVAMVWENCQLYYESDEGAIPYQMAEKMRIAAEGMEDEFWVELERFEGSLKGMSTNLAGMAAMADVAASHMGDRLNDAAALASDLTRSFGKWLWGEQPVDRDTSTAPPVKERHLFSCCRPCGKGKMVAMLEGGAPCASADREMTVRDVVSILADALGVGVADVEIDADLLWQDAGGLRVQYHVRLDDMRALIEAVDSFDTSATRARLVERLGTSTEIMLEPVTITKAMRTSLQEYYDDVLGDRFGFNPTQYLDDIEGELTEALERILPLLQEIDQEDEAACKEQEGEFPKTSAKVPLELLVRTGDGGRWCIQHAGVMRQNLATLSTKSMIKPTSSIEMAACENVSGLASVSSALFRQSVDTLRGECEVAADITKLKSILRPRDKNAGERTHGLGIQRYRSDGEDSGAC